MATDYSVHVLKEGYSYLQDGIMKANGSCTLVKGKCNVIVDTLSPWDKDIIISALAQHHLTCDDINYVVCTHGHVDHIGNLNLFTNAWHIVGFSVSKRDSYYIHPFEADEPYIIDDNLKVISTPGHTATDVSVIVRTKNQGVVAIVGDLFEREEDIDDEHLWKETAGSENPPKQQENRKKVALLADYIVPGHGNIFKVTDDIRQKLNN